MTLVNLFLHVPNFNGMIIAAGSEQEPRGTRPHHPYPLGMSRHRVHAKTERDTSVSADCIKLECSNPVCVSHSLIDLSLLHDTRWSPEGRKETDETLWS